MDGMDGMPDMSDLGGDSAPSFDDSDDEDEIKPEEVVAGKGKGKATDPKLEDVE